MASVTHLDHQNDLLRRSPTTSVVADQTLPRIASDGTKVAKRASRSKLGCTTCRKRKVKCDEGRPACQHCLRLHLACEYQTSTPSTTPRVGKQTASPKTPRTNIAHLTSSIISEATSQDASHRIHSDGERPISHEQWPVLSPSIPTADGDNGMRLQPLQPLVVDEGPRSFDDVVSLGLGQEFWNLDLLGQESIWAQLPIFSNVDGGADLAVFENSYPEYSSETTIPPILSNTDQARPSQNSAHTLDFNQQSPGSNISLSDIDPSEVILLRHFVDFAIPPILVGVEPRWKLARNVLLRIAKSSSLVRHAICSFSALSLSQKEAMSNNNQSSMHFYDLAFGELQDALERNESQDDHAGRLENEHILASIFFLSYVELMMSSRPKHTLEFLRRAHGISISSKTSIKTPLGNQLRIWLKLLDAKVVSAGGEGIHLLNNPDLKDFDGPADGVSEPTPPSGVDIRMTQDEEAPVTESDAEDILFHCINHSAYNFYLQVLDFAGRTAHLDKWHRSRGAVADELEVMTAAEQIVKDLDALWARRPQILDLAAQDNGQLEKYLCTKIAANVESHLRTYVANYYACFVHLQRVAYPYLETTPKTKAAVEQIVSLVRLCESPEDPSRLSVSMLWPLMMAGCEVEDPDTREWLIGVVEGMSERIGNAARTARLIREICRRQGARGQRADARTVMQEIFGTIFAII